MSTTNDGGPAFPHTRVYSDTPNDLMHQYLPMSGMTLRDYFAAKAMQAVIAASDNEAVEKSGPGSIADIAYEFADAMLLARKQAPK